VRQRLVEDKEGECEVLTRRVTELEAAAALHYSEVRVYARGVCSLQLLLLALVCGLKLLLPPRCMQPSATALPLLAYAFSSALPLLLCHCCSALLCHCSATAALLLLCHCSRVYAALIEALLRLF
jgi:hypothetical protein